MRYLYMLFLISVLSACTKPPTNKVPVEIQMRKAIVESLPNKEYLNYNAVELNLQRVILEASSEGSEQIEYDRGFEETLELDFSQNAIEEELNFALPQKKYSSIKLFFELDESQGPALVVKGTFTDQGTQEPILIEFNDLEELELKARQNGAEEELDFSNISELEGSLTLNPAFWTNTLAKQRLIMADRYLIDNVMTIYIDEQHNQQLYQTIVNRVDLKNYLEF